jgi:hypothetical protein
LAVAGALLTIPRLATCSTVVEAFASSSVDSGSKLAPDTVAVFSIVPPAEAATAVRRWIVFVSPLASGPTAQVISRPAETVQPPSSET